MNDNLTERLLELISAERDASAHHCDLRVDYSLTRQIGRGDIAGARRALEDAARELYAAQHAVTDALMGA
ncbi:MAG TPA: hypothetical protein VFJ22_02960 [Dermatophilaceae bacterium]|nr:hypothetical protein [Dermatophilaceae bacterium]